MNVWELMGGPLGRITVTDGPSPLGIGETMEVVPLAELAAARADERQRIVERLLHAANVVGPDEVAGTAQTLERMAMVLVTEGGPA